MISYDPIVADASALLAVFYEHAIPVGSCPIVNPDIQVLYERPLVPVRPDCHLAWRGHALPDDPDSLYTSNQRATALVQKRATFSCNGAVSHSNYKAIS